MIDLVRYESDLLTRFSERFSVTPLVLGGTRELTGAGLSVLDASGSSNKQLPSELAKLMPDVVFGCEWNGTRDHMDYPQNALRIQTARSIRDASAIYAITPRVFERYAIARFNVRVLREARVPIAFVSLAERDEEIANPKDLSAIGRILGMSDEEIARGRALLEALPHTRFDHAFSLESPRSATTR